MKTISIVAPNGQRIANGIKTIEVRSWVPDLGSQEDLLIVENKKFLKTDGEVDSEGIAVGIVRVAEVRAFERKDIPGACATCYAEGYYSWDLSCVRKLKNPFPVPAMRGIYNTDVSSLGSELMEIEDLKKPVTQTDDQRKDFYSKLPRKRSAVGVVILSEGKMLLIKPSYSKDWLVPGGIVESSESLLEAAHRECVEEIGCDVKISRMLCVDYKRGDEMRGDALHSLFLGHMSLDQEVKINSDEIIGYEWVPTQVALGWMESHLSKRVKCGLKAIEQNRTFYCEDGVVFA